MTKHWQLPRDRKPKKPNSSFSTGTIAIKSKSEIPAPAPLCTNALLAYRVTFEEKIPINFEGMARKLAHRWFLYDMHEKIQKLIAEHGDNLSIGISSPFGSDIFCSLLLQQNIS